MTSQLRYFVCDPPESVLCLERDDSMRLKNYTLFDKAECGITGADPGIFKRGNAHALFKVLLPFRGNQLYEISIFAKIWVLPPPPECSILRLIPTRQFCQDRRHNWRYNQPTLAPIII